MPTSMPSIPSALAIGAALLAAQMITAPCLAQPAQPATPAPASSGARQSISDHGQASLERLERAIANTRDGAVDQRHPVLSKGNDPDAERRAFDGLHRRPVPKDLETRAHAAYAQGAAGLAAERERQARALRVALGLEPSEERALALADPAQPVGNNRQWVPVVFVSSSMPLATLRSYAEQLERARGVMALRGVPGGLRKMGPMAKLSAEILRFDPGCEGPACLMRNVQLVVDPIVFRQHGVAGVPALAMIPGDPTQTYCERDDDSQRASHIVYGDAALSGLLEEYARLGGKEEVRHAQALLGIR